MRQFSDSAVASVFRDYPPAVRAKLMALRELVFDTAAGTAGAGRPTETLKWGQPSYVPEETGSGTTIRIDRLPVGPLRHCLALAFTHHSRRKKSRS